MVDFNFQPSTLTVNAGETVTWVNGGPSEHNASAKDKSARQAFFETAIIADGDQDSITFNDPGTYDYFCAVHPPDADPKYANFVGTITVLDRSGNGGSGNGNGNGNENGNGSGNGGTDPGVPPVPFVGPSVPTADSGSLPNTGLDLLPPLIAGAGLLALGLLLRAAYLELVWRGR